MKFIPLCSGSSGNSVYIEAGDQRILVDAGVSCRRLCGLLTEAGGDPGQLTAILITHEHTDHIKGLAVLSKSMGFPYMPMPIPGVPCGGCVPGFRPKMPASLKATRTFIWARSVSIPLPHPTMPSTP